MVPLMFNFLGVSYWVLLKSIMQKLSLLFWQIYSCYPIFSKVRRWVKRGFCVCRVECWEIMGNRLDEYDKLYWVCYLTEIRKWWEQGRDKHGFGTGTGTGGSENRFFWKVGTENLTEFSFWFRFRFRFRFRFFWIYPYKNRFSIKLIKNTKN